MLCILDVHALYTMFACFTSILVYVLCLHLCILCILCVCALYTLCAGLDTRYPYLVYQPCLLYMHAVLDPFHMVFYVLVEGGNLLLSCQHVNDGPVTLSEGLVMVVVVVMVCSDGM